MPPGANILSLLFPSSNHVSQFAEAGVTDVAIAGPCLPQCCGRAGSWIHTEPGCGRGARLDDTQTGCVVPGPSQGSLPEYAHRPEEILVAVLLGLNVLQVGCKDGQNTLLGSIYAYVAPVLYLVTEVAVLLLIIWIEGGIALSTKQGKAPYKQDLEGSRRLESRSRSGASSPTYFAHFISARYAGTSGERRHDPDRTQWRRQVDAGQPRPVRTFCRPRHDSPERRRCSDTRSTKVLGVYTDGDGAVWPGFDALDLMNTRGHSSFSTSRLMRPPWRRSFLVETRGSPARPLL
ncbi:hypothetical protein TOPH_05214 [Tolypocladium ophioglossoides CBS 100239]|uniref:Uncharacterized protein n=1 Tax=Tolypocladium ophioglossoides (strain CBS 100239) TaxID=1163406 RepID=A0A0L0N7W0_TOLOC|nr:hypothetical protein TOPH_05214 [Tolypocladium ophioglossoides CBS 100239]